MKYVRMTMGYLLVPTCLAATGSFFELTVNLGKRVSANSIPFWAGLVSYFIFQAVFFRPIRTYVFGHELTHALVGVLSGARLKRFKVSSRGGSVVLTKTNLWIALAPYFIPLYTTFLVVVYWSASRFWPMTDWQPYFLFLAGFSLSFHFSLTHFALSLGQSDLKQFGVFFSSVIILLINFIFLAVLLKLLFPHDVNVKRFFVQSAEKTFFIWQLLYAKGKQLWFFFQSMK